MSNSINHKLKALTRKAPSARDRPAIWVRTEVPSTTSSVVAGKDICIAHVGHAPVDGAQQRAPARYDQPDARHRLGNEGGRCNVKHSAAC